MGGFEVSHLGALGAGILSFLSPCVLPLVPPYLCFIGGVSLEQMTDDSEELPPGVMRGFRNVGDEHGILMAILGGTDTGKVTWSPSVLMRARASGLDLDDDGNIVESR